MRRIAPLVPLQATGSVWMFVKDFLSLRQLISRFLAGVVRKSISQLASTLSLQTRIDNQIALLFVRYLDITIQVGH